MMLTCTLIPVPPHVKMSFIICSKSSPKQKITRWLMGCRGLSKDNNIPTSVPFCIELKKSSHMKVIQLRMFKIYFLVHVSDQ